METTTSIGDEEKQAVESDQESEENFGDFNPNLKARLLLSDRELY
jgi:hypothetical protein